VACCACSYRLAVSQSSRRPPAKASGEIQGFGDIIPSEQAEKEAAALPPPPAPANPDLKPTPEETTRFEQIAEISPRAAIMELRRELEEYLKSVAIEYDLTSPTYPLPMSLASIIRLLRNRNIIDPHTSALLDDLRVVGNTAAHGGDGTEFSKADALRYRNLADEVFRRFATMKLIAEPDTTSLGQIVQ
jgi:Domain of unknown function (DUF4145)